MENTTTVVRTKELQPVTVLAWMTAAILDKNGEIKTPSTRVPKLDLATCVHTAENGNTYIKMIAVEGHHDVKIVGMLKSRACTIYRADVEDYEAYLGVSRLDRSVLDPKDWDPKTSKKDDATDLSNLDLS